jgi:hypothetical protein
MKNKRFLSVFLAVVFLFAVTTKQTQAKWDDKSNKLPGTVSDGTIYALAGVAAVGVGVLVYVLIKKKNQNQSVTSLVNYMTIQAGSMEKEFMNLRTEDENKSSTPRSNIFFNNETTFLQKMETASRIIPVDVMVTPLASANNIADGNTNGIQVGIRIRF